MAGPVPAIHVARRRHCWKRSPGAGAAVTRLPPGRLWIVLAVALGFLAGAAAFALTDIRGVLLAVAIVVALALWAFYREKHPIVIAREGG